MGSLPEELWIQILQSGLQNAQLQYRDLCALAIVSRKLKRISELDCLWKQLLAQYLTEGAVLSCKQLYRRRYEWVKANKVASQKRHVLIVTSALHVLQRESQILQESLQSERDILVSLQTELENLEHASRTSVALQPQAVDTGHEQVVQEIPVDLAARKNSLCSEIRSCESRIHCVENTLRSHKSTIEGRQCELEALTDCPTMDLASLKDVFGKKHPTMDLASLKDVFGKKRGKKTSQEATVEEGHYR